MKKTAVLIIGCGLAGCITALELAEKGVAVTLIGSGESNSAAAQGGIVYRGEGDSCDLLTEDIQRAGCGLSLSSAAQRLALFGPRLVQELLVEKYQVPFERDQAGHLQLTREAAHSCARIIYFRDETGQAIMRALLDRVAAHPLIHFKRGFMAVDLITLSHHSKTLTDIYFPSTCVGAYVMNPADGSVEIIYAGETVLATGGVGELFLHTTNPKEARGDGVAMAFRAGARIMNMEYVQFHPTTLYLPSERRFLLSEALRGEGAELLSADGKPFMQRYHASGNLAPRDVVARSIYEEMLKHNAAHLWLDMSFRESAWIKGRFPAIYDHALKRGYDLTQEPLPVVPAAHYACGGVAVDETGKTNIARLRAIGEVSCTGVHGANRLASTSLLEALVWAKHCADDIALHGKVDYFPQIDEWVMGTEVVDSALVQQDWLSIKQTMWNYVGLIRDKPRLLRALKMLEQLKSEIEFFYEKSKLTPELLHLRNGVLTALLVTQGALRNKQSLGCHYRLS